MMFATLFTSWSNFYVITGSSAAALTGLMFVVVTLIDSDIRPEVQREGTSTFSTPTVMHFAAAFVVSALASIPWPSPLAAAVVLAIGSAGATAVVLRNALRMSRFGEEYTPDADDWIWFAGLPLVSYVAILAGALTLPLHAQASLFALAGADLLLIIIGIRNAWDIVTFIAIVRPAQEREQPR